MNRISPWAGVAVAAMLLATAAQAGDFQSGLSAYDAADFETARAEWTDAAIAGDPQAQYRLGLMLANGVGAPRDVISAYAWLFLAGKGGVGEAKPKYDELQKDYIPRHCHFEAMALVRDFETGKPQKLVAGGRERSRCWNFKQN